MTLDSYAIRAGTTARTLLVFLRSAAEPGHGQPELRHDTPGGMVAYVREGDVSAHRIPLVEGRPGEHRPGGWAEVDQELAPGLYELGVPDPMLAEGSPRAVLFVRFPGTACEPVEIDLVGYDAQDSVRLGMSAISPEARIAALRGAFPRLTERELRTEETTEDSG
ncbi:MAG: hypothetical protein H0W27_01715 [Actinobacteria bacterium]|nr:hypothetical protein [Actinomycetota bacterium]